MAITLNGTTGIVSPKVNALDLELDSKNVVERGSNANGEYVRFADGTQICTMQSGSLAINDLYVNLYRSAATGLPYPAAFVTEPACSIACSSSTLVWGAVRPRLTQASCSLYCPASTTQSAVVTAIGRWY